MAGVFFDFFLDFVQFLVLLLLFAVESLQALLQGLFSFVLRVGLALRLADQVTDELVLGEILRNLINFVVIINKQSVRLSVRGCGGGSWCP